MSSKRRLLGDTYSWRARGLRLENNLFLPAIDLDLTFRNLEENFATMIFISVFSFYARICAWNARLNWYSSLKLGNVSDNVSFVFKRAECSVCAASYLSRLPSAIFWDKVDSTGVQYIVRCDNASVICVILITGGQCLLKIQFCECVIISQQKCERVNLIQWHSILIEF